VRRKKERESGRLNIRAVVAIAAPDIRSASRELRRLILASDVSGMDLSTKSATDGR